MEKKQTREAKRLTLNRETLRSLGDSELRKADGGASIAGTCNTCNVYGTAACCHLT